MSQWFEVSDEDIEIHQKEKEIFLCVTSDDCGNIWATITFAQLERIYKEALLDPIAKQG
ncbi:MAG: hypothetical protein O7D95_03010 [Betaproteobacteria bacterium]|nr:hypothetical protein [Betaproteobacteria bacterium]